MKSPIHESRAGLWDQNYAGQISRSLYGKDPLTAIKAAKFFRKLRIRTIEDWGCGRGGFQDYLRWYQRYVGIDGSKTKYADITADLVDYTSRVDAIHIRHVLEHNPEWETILTNAICSFRKRLVLTIFTPFQPDHTKVIAEYENWQNSGITMVDIGFRKSDLTKYFESKGITWHSEENLETRSQYNIEHIFYLKKKK